MASFLRLHIPDWRYKRLCHTGSALEDGWTAIKVVRKDSKSKGDAEIYYISPSGKKLRSQSHVFKFLQIPVADPLKSEAATASHSSHHQAAASEGTSFPETSQVPASAPPANEGTCGLAEFKWMVIGCNRFTIQKMNIRGGMPLVNEVTPPIQLWMLGLD